MNNHQLRNHLKEKATRLRIHSLRATAEAGSGHPTSCLSAADLAAVLFFHVMRVDFENPLSLDSDRFILSKGHAAPLLYAAWVEAGLIEASRLLALRRFGSDLEGHPTPRSKWVDVATGSLGQGLSVGVGMALSAKYLDRSGSRTFVLMGDGESAEGSVWEAAAMASHYRLDNLVTVVDINRLGQSQETMHGWNVEAYARKFAGFGWHAISIDGHDFGQIIAAFEEAEGVEGRPTALLARTEKGHGVSLLANREGWHGKALKKGEQLDRALQELPLNSDPEPFRGSGQGKVSTLPGVRLREPKFRRGDLVATREAYGSALVKLGECYDNVVALDGDTKNSTFSEKFMKVFPDRFFECFIAEQNMIGAAIGLSKKNKIPFASTFAAFFGRGMDQLRMGVISRANIKCVGSHCGISIGEDGPSQMGLEDLALFRSLPGSVVFYPCDAVSTERVVALAAEHRGLVYIRTSRPKTAVIYDNREVFRVGGSKVLRSSQEDRLLVVAAGVTVREALKAHDLLLSEEIPIRVMDAYCVKPVDEAGLVEAASASRRTVIVVEEHYSEGGLGDAVLNAVANHKIGVHKMAVREVPRSGKPDELLDYYGLSANRIAAKVKELLALPETNEKRQKKKTYPRRATKNDEGPLRR